MLFLKRDKPEHITNALLLIRVLPAVPFHYFFHSVTLGRLKMACICSKKGMWVSPVIYLQRGVAKEFLWGVGAAGMGFGFDLDESDLVACIHIEGAEKGNTGGW